jgi:hypothetical protein
MILLISPSVGGVGFAEYVCAHPGFTNYFTRDGNGDPIPDSPRGIPLLGDGDGEDFIPTGK